MDCIIQKRNLLYFFFLSMLWVATVANAADHLVLPKPQKIVEGRSSFVFGKMKLSTPVLLQELEEFVARHGGTVNAEGTSSIEVSLLPSLDGVPVNQQEAYRLEITRNKIRIEAVAERGVYRAIQTLSQLAKQTSKKTTIRGCEILDWPAFRIRGFMQDVGRSYISLEELKCEIAILSKFKITVR